MKAERAHELDDEGAHAHGAMGGFANRRKRGDDRVFGGATGAAENGAMFEQFLGERAVAEIADDFVEFVDFFGVDAELIDDAGAALNAADERMDAGVQTFEELLRFSDAGAGVFV
jgi:hypothetical protein